MSKIKFGVALVAAAWVGVFACSSGSGGTSSCIASAVGSTCFSCLQAHCESQLSDFDSACSELLSCICPGGNFSCSADESTACTEIADGESCTSAGTSLSRCDQANCESECSDGGATCDGGAATSTICTGSASLDGGTCTNGQLLSSCSTTTGGTTSCYYTVGTEHFACISCTDTTSCAQAANAACH